MITRLRHARADEGFTLIELLVVIVLIGVISVPLVNVIIGYLRNTTATTGRLNESHDAQLAGSYFTQDAASVGTRADATPTAALAQSIWLGPPSTYPCGSTTPVIEMVSDDLTAPASVTIGYNRVVYAVQTSGTQTQLHRLACAGSATVTSNVTVAHNVDASITPSVTCSTGGVTVSCTSAAVPQSVTLTFSVRDPAAGAVAGYTDYQVVLTGQRRST